MGQVKWDRSPADNLHVPSSMLYKLNYISPTLNSDFQNTICEFFSSRVAETPRTLTSAEMEGLNFHGDSHVGQLFNILTPLNDLLRFDDICTLGSNFGHSA